MAGFEFCVRVLTAARRRSPFGNVFFTGLIRDGEGPQNVEVAGQFAGPARFDRKVWRGRPALRSDADRAARAGYPVRRKADRGRAQLREQALECGAFPPDARPEHARAIAGRGCGFRFTRWIFSAKLEGLLRQTEAAYAAYRFNEAGGALYEFFWSQYCDWYVEAAKTEIFAEEAESKRSALLVMDFVLWHVLRLLHPFMPHITEELWERLGFAGPNHGAGNLLMFAHFPTGTLGLETAAAQVRAAAVYSAVGAARNLRAEYRVASSKKVRFVLKPSVAWAAEEIPTFSRLINAEEIALEAGYEAPAGAPRALTGLGELYMPLAGAVDTGAERERLQKEMAKVEQELATVRKKLANENFVGNAPRAVVEEHRQRETAWAEKLGQLETMKKWLGI